jgi:hypothetical protein
MAVSNQSAVVIRTVSRYATVSSNAQASIPWLTIQFRSIMALFTSRAMPMQHPPDDSPWHRLRRSRLAIMVFMLGGVSPACALVNASAAI